MYCKGRKKEIHNKYVNVFLFKKFLLQPPITYYKFYDAQFLIYYLYRIVLAS